MALAERRERNGRKAGANGDELMASEVGPSGAGERCGFVSAGDVRC